VETIRLGLFYNGPPIASNYPRRGLATQLQWIFCLTEEQVATLVSRLSSNPTLLGLGPSWAASGAGPDGAISNMVTRLDFLPLSRGQAGGFLVKTVHLFALDHLDYKESAVVRTPGAHHRQKVHSKYMGESGTSNCVLENSRKLVFITHKSSGNPQSLSCQHTPSQAGRDQTRL